MPNILPPLPRRIPGHPDHHYYVASGGYWVHGPDGFVALFATRRDLATYIALLGGA